MATLAGVLKPAYVLLLIGSCLALRSALVDRVEADDEVARAPYGRWSHGPPTDAGYFPIAVWLQNPRNAARYKAAGINLYVGLWRGPTPEQLSELQTAGMQLICAQNATARARLESPVVVGWMHGDEPDNAQELGRGQGYGPPITPEHIIESFEKIRATDSSRPVLLNLGQGVAWDNYIGRGVRRNHPEDYPRYVQGCDIASFDIYPVVHDAKEIAGHLEYVGRGVERLMQWAGPERIVWNCIECTHIGNPDRKATPQQVRSEVWMALVHGSRGLIYFVHQFRPSFNEAALLDDPALLAAVTQINQQIRNLAPVLNSPSVTNALHAQSRPATAEGSLGPTEPIASLQKRHRGKVYLFAVNMTAETVHTRFILERGPVNDPPATPAQIQVLEENRSIMPGAAGHFEDTFEPYAVHLYAWLESVPPAR
jgi:hypothetical protein